MADAERNHRLGRLRTLIFIDEIHRFNKAQQDAFLPYVERGDIVLIGATTENPSFEVISALLSRTKVTMLKPLTEEIVGLLGRALPVIESRRPKTCFDKIAIYANGDARRFEHPGTCRLASRCSIPAEALRIPSNGRCFSTTKPARSISTLSRRSTNSVRSSDVDAALYWLGRMLPAGEGSPSPRRRLVRMAIEDIGLADPRP